MSSRVRYQLRQMLFVYVVDFFGKLGDDFAAKTNNPGECAAKFVGKQLFKFSKKHLNMQRETKKRGVFNFMSQFCWNSVHSNRGTLGTFPQVPLEQFVLQAFGPTAPLTTVLGIFGRLGQGAKRDGVEGGLEDFGGFLASNLCSFSFRHKGTLPETNILVRT